MWRRLLRILGLVHEVDEVDVDEVEVEVDEVDVDEVEVEVDEVDVQVDASPAGPRVAAPAIAAPVIGRPRRRVIVRADDERATVLFVPALAVTREDGAPTVMRR